MLDRLEVIELDRMGRRAAEVEFAQEKLGFKRQKQEFPDYGGSGKVKNFRATPLGHARAQKPAQDQVLVPLLLAIAGLERCRRKGLRT